MISEAIEILKTYTDGKDNTDKVEISVMQLNRIIKALEQQPTDAVDRVTIKEYLESFGNIKTEKEPCEDAISRQAVEDTIINYRWKYSALYERIKQLPSVTPQPKMGRWIEHFDESGKWYECDQCHTDWGGYVNYCPNCGAKMQEVNDERTVHE